MVGYSYLIINTIGGFFLNILVIGDIVGKPGRRIVKENLSRIINDNKIDFTIANGENASGGRGINREALYELNNAGIDVLTMGNHVWDNKEIFKLIDEEVCLIRPANYPADCPGRGYYIYTAGFSKKIAVINLSGRVFMNSLNCPFQSFEEILKEIKGKADILIVDFHAEATSEKLAFAYNFDGKATAILGTHTHIQTSDEKILPKGTGYITDLGMTGPIDSILGMKKEQVIEKFITQRPVRLEVADGVGQLQGVILKIDEESNQLESISRISLMDNS